MGEKVYMRLYSEPTKAAVRYLPQTKVQEDAIEEKTKSKKFVVHSDANKKQIVDLQKKRIIGCKTWFNTYLIDRIISKYGYQPNQNLISRIFKKTRCLITLRPLS